MSKKLSLAALVILALLLATCATAEPTDVPPTEAIATEPATPTASVEVAPTVDVAVPDRLLISELLPGVHGVDNTLEFIEIYNPMPEAMDLQGWSLWYRFADDREEELVYAWAEPVEIPGQGHWLLVRSGAKLEALPDSEYAASLFELKGGLTLRSPDGTVADSLVWGDGPSENLAGAPAPAPMGGSSLERLPGGAEGNAQNTPDNSIDFVLTDEPQPQNSGDLPTPLAAERLSIRLEAPQAVQPGIDLEYSVLVQNHTGQTLEGGLARIPIPEGFEVLSLPDGAQYAEGWVAWNLPLVAADSDLAGIIGLRSPWTYATTIIRGYYVEDASGRNRAYGPLQALAVEGGTIPIAAARTLSGETVTIEGIATMFTDGFFAGTTGTKFYMEDETGGIQVYCPGGKGLVQVAVGERVRVTGQIEVYRDSLEIVPGTYPDDVQVLQPAEAMPEPAEVAIQAASSDESLLGRLISVEGTATRIEEFTYSYEVDLMDDEGVILLAYVEKDAGLTAEPLDLGSRYRVTGISELYDGNWQIKPRLQSDLAEIFPPVLMLDLDARNSVQAGGLITYTLTVRNHTPAPLTRLVIEAPVPADEIVVTDIYDSGTQEGTTISWKLAEFADGGLLQVRYVVRVDDVATGPIVAQPALASADGWLEPAESGSLLTFVGDGVPIWAVQGPGVTSPYVRDQATTVGIVTGVFPDLGGFWIQENETDDDPATSAGLFVLAPEVVPPLELGDQVRVTGKVRELSGQTLLDVSSASDIELLGSGDLLPAAVDLDPPIDPGEADAYYEALEGMLVRVGEPAVAVGPTSKYGETPLVLQNWGIDRIMKGDPMGLLIYIDDGSAATHTDQSSLAFPLKTGDLLLEAVGPLAYTYENFKIEPISLPTIQVAERPLPILDEPNPGQVSIATFNAENLFDPQPPHPSDPPMPSRAQYALDLTKMSNTILSMGAPTIIGLQEIENLEILEDLVEHPALLRFEYQPFLIEGTDSRGIDVAYMVRGDRADIIEAIAHPAPDGLTSRPPLLLTVRVHLESGDRTLYLLNNHFTSMSGGELPTEPRRKAQSAWNVELVDAILADEPEAYVVVLGDLNSFYESPPIDLLRAAGLRHVYELLEPLLPYTYIYQGESETLDHILVTQSLYDHLEQVVALHLNADFPPPIPDDESARGTSDHDPLLAIFTFD